MIKELYISEARMELEKYPVNKSEFITENDIKSLPKPVKRYFQYCGFIGQEKMFNAEIEWKNAYIKSTYIC